jgi:hypothetical protein
MPFFTGDSNDFIRHYQEDDQASPFQKGTKFGIKIGGTRKGNTNSFLHLTSFHRFGVHLLITRGLRPPFLFLAFKTMSTQKFDELTPECQRVMVALRKCKDFELKEISKHCLNIVEWREKRNFQK